MSQIAEEDGEINIAIIAEKPSVAKMIARSLSNVKKLKTITDTWEGYEAYQFSWNYNGISSQVKVLSVYGHIYK